MKRIKEKHISNLRNIEEFEWDEQGKFLVAMGECLPTNFSINGVRETIDFRFVDYLANEKLWNYEGWFYQSLNGKYDVWVMISNPQLEKKWENRKKKIKEKKIAALLK